MPKKKIRFTKADLEANKRIKLEYIRKHKPKKKSSGYFAVGQVDKWMDNLP
jgi:hypothetical protein